MKYDYKKLDVEIIVKYDGDIVAVDITDNTYESLYEDVEEYMEFISII
jgi:hypothetical protein|tara:strand:+ start:295 stop:438 length:144 start_codon:yes stop_codon:yes gene_type:complete